LPQAMKLLLVGECVFWVGWSVAESGAAVCKTRSTGGAQTQFLNTSVRIR